MSFFERLILLPRPAKRAFILALDILNVPVSLYLAAALLSGTLPGAEWLGQEIGILLTLALGCAALSMTLGLPGIQLKSYEISAMGRSAALAALLAALMAATSWAFGQARMAGEPFIFALVFLFLSATVRLVLLQLLLHLYRRDVAATKVLIYGAGKTGMQLAMALKSHEAVRLMGFIDDNSVLHGMTVAGLPVHPSQRLEKLIAEQKIGRVLLAMPSLSPPRQAQVARRVAALGVDVQSLPSFAQLVGEEEIVATLAPVLPESFLGRKKLHGSLNGAESRYRGKSVMISGAGGSIGSELCRQILPCGPTRLVLLELSELALYNIDREMNALAEGTGCEIVPVLGSVADAAKVTSVLKRHEVQIVLHAAAYKHVPMVEANPDAGIINNVFGTQVLAQAAIDCGIERFVLISTDKAVRPTGVMGASKRLAELVVGDLARRSGKTILTMVRFGNVLGSSGSVIPLFQEQILRGGPITLTDPRVTRYFMTVQEATQLVLWAGSMAKGGEIFVLDMGKPVAIERLARQIVESSGYKVRDASNPDGDIEILVTGLRPGEKLHEELSISPDLRPTAHPKLFHAEETSLTEFELARALQGLNAAIVQQDHAAIVEEAARWVKRDLAKNEASRHDGNAAL
ncbi:MAG: polysaccharide biosynthesis protein [Pararhodobacter sp.]|nr:polysaccharide biosynthesis protein [Pararhodobacter sp.]